ncbi:DUF397 domain-containing protein [Streptomyces sp. NBC_01618]
MSPGRDRRQPPPPRPVRDSKRPAGPVIGFGRGAWQAFVRDLG